MRYTIVLFMALFLCACATPVKQDCPPPLPPKIVDTACNWAQPIQVGASDTVETKRAAIAAWSTYRKNCPSSK